MRSITLISFIILLFFYGCSSTTSDNIKTSGIYAIFTIESQTGSANVVAKATLQVGGITGSYIKLVDDDKLFCDDKELSMYDSKIGPIEYKAQIPKKNAGEKYVFKFKRKDEEHLIELVQLKDINVIQPNQSQNFKITQDIKLKWEPISTEDMDISIDGDCIDPYTKNLSADNGEFLIPKGTLIFDEDSETNQCPAIITVRRYKSTDVPKAFEGGRTFTSSKSVINIQIEK